MDRPQPTSQEKLGQMLASGTITAEDYERLSEALHTSDAAAEASEEQATDALGTPAAKRLRKNWSRRLLAGVCTGIADYFALDPVIVRVVAVVLAVVALPVTPFVYLALAFVLPWDDEGTARETRSAGPPWWFAIRLFVLLDVVPACLAIFILRPLVRVYMELGAELPGLTQLSIDVLGSFGRIVSCLVLGGIVIAVLTALDWVCRDSPMRGVYRVCCIAVALLWPLLIVLGLIFPFFEMGKAIR